MATSIEPKPESDGAVFREATARNWRVSIQMQKFTACDDARLNNSHKVHVCYRRDGCEFRTTSPRRGLRALTEQEPGDTSRLLASQRGLKKSFLSQAKMSVQCRVQ